MSCIKTKTGENTITFDAFYQYIWARNYGDTDVYISTHNNIVAGDDDVALLPAGEAVRLTVNGKTIYVLGSTTLEVHAQNFSDAPFAWNEAGDGGGSDVSVVSLSVNENGTYTAPSGTAYSPVTVNVPANVGTKIITHDGTYNASSDNLDGYSSVVVDTGYKYVIPDTYKELDYVVCPSWSNQAYFQVPFKLEIGDYIVTKSEISSDWNKNSEGDFIGDGNTWLIGYQNGQIYTWTRDISLYNFTGDPRDYVEGAAYDEIIKVTANAANFNTYIGCYRPGDYRFKGKIFRTTQYRTSLSNENIPIMNVLYDLIPCERKSDNIVGMYDAVNNVFYTSVSSTAFVAPSE